MKPELLVLDRQRTVPIAQVPRAHLIGHRFTTGRAEGLVFGMSSSSSFTSSNIRRRAELPWSKENKQRIAAEEETTEAEGREVGEVELLDPIGWHECRHMFASLMIGAGGNAKALSTYMGHASITITLDRYGHLMPGNETETAGLLDRYLKRAAAK